MDNNLINTTAKLFNMFLEKEKTRLIIKYGIQEVIKVFNDDDYYIESIKDTEDCVYDYLCLIFSQGLERMLKRILCLDEYVIKNKYPSNKYLRDFKHDLERLYISLCNRVRNNKLIDFKMIHLRDKNKNTKIILSILTSYYTNTRYDSLNYLTDAPRAPYLLDSFFEMSSDYIKKEMHNKKKEEGQVEMMLFGGEIASITLHLRNIENLYTKYILNRHNNIYGKKKVDN
ncbi:MAG: hypothetical protein NTW26_03945 [bacterium]|nr:hypothetical protein [bacterium]